MTDNAQRTLCDHRACCRRMAGHEGDHDYAPDTEYALLQERMRLFEKMFEKAIGEIGVTESKAAAYIESLQAEVEKLDRVRAWLKEKPPYNTPRDDKEALARAIGYEDAAAEVAERIDDPDPNEYVEPEV